MKSQLIIALDVPAASDIPPIVDELGDQVCFYKVGLELFTAEGPAALEYLRKQQKRIFLDLKLHDIPRTVARAVGSAARHGVDLLTVHACGGPAMLAAAAEAAAESDSGAGSSPLKLLAITVLTSLNADDLAAVGVSRDVTTQAVSLGKLAISSGIDGLVCSPQEVAHFRQALQGQTPAERDRPLLVTPGIRPAGGELGDQKRVATPAMAVQGGATHLVVGRPILQADDRREAAEAILREMESAL